MFYSWKKLQDGNDSYSTVWLQLLFLQMRVCIVQYSTQYHFGFKHDYNFGYIQ